MWTMVPKSLLKNHLSKTPVGNVPDRKKLGILQAVKPCISYCIYWNCSGGI